MLTIRESGLEQVRIGWCDLHGVLRGKTLMAPASRSFCTTWATVGPKDELNVQNSHLPPRRLAFASAAPFV